MAIRSELAGYTSAQARTALEGLPRCDYEVVVIHTTNNKVKTTTGVRGSRFGSERDHSHEIQVRTDMIHA